MMDRATQAGIYLHIPFCRKKCGYCSFHSFPPKTGDIGRFYTAARQQLRQLAHDPEVQTLSFATVFFGGGTPSMLPVEMLATLLTDCRDLFSFATDEPETTVEVNPGTIDGRGLQRLRRAGFNRLSIGVQSFDDQELQLLGRIHSGQDAQTCIIAARQAGFDNLSFDLMYGLPNQTLARWQAALDQALSLTPVHLSMYELTVETETPFAAEQRRGAWALPAEETVLAMMAAIDATIASSSLRRYEISNYAAPGCECRHNLNYWHNGDYIGIGPGAVAAWSGRRRAAVADLSQYCQRVASGEGVWEESEALDDEAKFRETVIMGLRLLAGVSLEELRQRFGIDLVAYYGASLSPLFNQGVVSLDEGRFHLTPTGLPVANRIMAELV